MKGKNFADLRTGTLVVTIDEENEKPLQRSLAHEPSQTMKRCSSAIL